MSLKKEVGCETPQNKADKDIYRRLVAMHAPILAFDPDERFFPVDLPSTRKASALYHITGDRTNANNKQLVTKSIQDIDLANADKDHFTTVIPEERWKTEINTISQPPFKMPVPDIKAIHQRYKGTGIDRIDAKLTIYGSVCRANVVPNYKELLEQRTLKDPKIFLALGEGLIINYYFFFPAMDTPELKREGDWSGISILLDRVPSPNDLSSAKPVLLCYFKKVRDLFTGYDYLWSGPEGFRTPNKGVIMSSVDGEMVASHPLVYISKGRHNCYFENYQSETTTLPTGSPWIPAPDPEKVEDGAYSSKQEGGTSGESEDYSWMLGFLFLPLFLLACPARGRKSGRIYEDVEDVKRSGGHDIKPEKNPSASTNYPPSGQPGPTPYKLDVEYVDTDSDLAMKANWGFAGYWGVAEREAHPFKGFVEEEVGATTQEIWGRFGGVRRPNLAAWFLWNLYFDTFYGAGATTYTTPGV